MAVIDVQVHAYERNHAGRPWVGELHGPASASGEEMVAFDGDALPLRQVLLSKVDIARPSEAAPRCDRTAHRARPRA